MLHNNNLTIKLIYAKIKWTHFACTERIICDTLIDAELTRDFTRHQAIKEESESAGTQDSEDECKENQSLQHNAVSQNMPNSVVSNTTCNNFQSSQTLSQVKIITLIPY
jgi:hypothetical protein